MSEQNDNKSFGSALVMPVTGSGCGIRPSKEAMEVEFGIDFTAAKTLLDQQILSAEEPIDPQSPKPK